MLPGNGAYSALHTEKAYDLDICDVKAKTGTQLYDHIENAVKGTQSVVARAYPDRLVMTPEQYDLLEGSPQFMNIGEVGQTYWLYRTKYNVMEIEVKK